MPLLFSYGTLQQAEVQQSVFGRRVDSRRDELAGYVREAVMIEGSQEANVRAGSGSVAGVVLDVTEAELARSDEYELPYGYSRIKVKLASGAEAWVYLCDASSRP